MTSPSISDMPAAALVPQALITPISQQPRPTDALSHATQAYLVESAHTSARQLRELSHDLQLTTVLLSEHGQAMRAQVAAESHRYQLNPDMSDIPLPPAAQAIYTEMFAPGAVASGAAAPGAGASGAAAPEAKNGLNALLEMLGEREKELDFNATTNRIQGLQKGMRDMFLKMTNAVEIFSNKFAEFSGSVSPTAKDGNIKADFSLAGQAAKDAWEELRKTVVTVSDPKNTESVLQGLRAASGLKQFFSADTTGGGKNLELLTLDQVNKLLDPVYKALGGKTNGLHTKGEQTVSSMKYQEVKSTMDGVAEQLKTRMNQMMDGFGRVNEVYDSLMKILTSTYQADADSRKSFLQ